MADKTQTFANHGQYLPMFHFFASPLALIFVVWSVTRLFANPSFDTAYMLVGSLALFGAVAVARLSPLRAQDRLIHVRVPRATTVTTTTTGPARRQHRF